MFYKLNKRHNLILVVMSMTVFAFSMANNTKAYAADKGDWLLRFGAIQVSPNDSSGTLSGAPTVGVSAEYDTQAFVTISYMFEDHLAVELLASTPFTHTISATGALTGDIATVKQLPPTLSVQYHFSPKAAISPYVGAGINYTIFFDEKATAVISSIKLDNSWGLAVQAGADIDLGDNWFANVDLRYIDIETTATTNLGTVDVSIDPWIVSLGVGFKF